MDNQMQVFEHKEFGSLGVLMIDGKPHFPATECAKVLGYRNTKDAIIRHCKGIVKHDLLTNGGNQKTNYISEGDLYRLIIRSKLPAAAAFEAWVCDEVLPSIRRNGAYITDETLIKMLGDSEFGRALILALYTQTERVTTLEGAISTYASKVRYFDVIMQSNNTVPVSLIAKDYGMSAVAFNRLLNRMGIQYKIGGTWILYQNYAGMGYTQSLTYPINEFQSVMRTCWTQKGRLFLYDVLKHRGIVPLAERREGAKSD
jgi:prophage antirepressor-like protein